MTRSGQPIEFPRRPVPPESAIDDPTLDRARFQQGFDDASAYLGTLPRRWASHLASSTLAAEPVPDIAQSYERGYRAALYGFLHHGRGRG